MSLVLLALIGCAYRYKKGGTAKRSYKRLKLYEYYSLLISHYKLVVRFFSSLFCVGRLHPPSFPTNNENRSFIVYFRTCRVFLFDRWQIGSALGNYNLFRKVRRRGVVANNEHGHSKVSAKVGKREERFWPRTLVVFSDRGGEERRDAMARKL